MDIKEGPIGAAFGDIYVIIQFTRYLIFLLTVLGAYRRRNEEMEELNELEPGEISQAELEVMEQLGFGEYDGNQEEESQ